MLVFVFLFNCEVFFHPLLFLVVVFQFKRINDYDGISAQWEKVKIKAGKAPFGKPKLTQFEGAAILCGAINEVSELMLKWSL